MRPARCSRVVALVASLAGMAAMAPAIAQQPAPNPREWLRSGPMVGPAERTETTVWLQTTRPARVQVRFWPEGDPSKGARLSAEVDLHRGRGGPHRPPAAHRPRVRHALRLRGLPRRAARRPALPRRLPDPAVLAVPSRAAALHVATGSCFFANDPGSDRPGKPYGRSPEIFEGLPSSGRTSCSGSATTSTTAFRIWKPGGAARALREGPGGAATADAAGRAHHYAIWDDHDFGPDNVGRTVPRRGGRRGLPRLLAQPHLRRPGRPAIFTRFPGPTSTSSCSTTACSVRRTPARLARQAIFGARSCAGCWRGSPAAKPRSRWSPPAVSSSPTT